MPKVINVKSRAGGNIILLGQSLNDTLVAGNGVQTLHGNAGDDLLIAGNGAQTLLGGSGDDRIVAGLGQQTYDGGAGADTLDFSRLNVKVVVDQDLHFANYKDAGRGAVLFSSSVTSFETFIGSNAGNDFHAAANNAGTFVGGAASDIYRSENGGDKVTLGAGNDVFGWFRKYVETGKADHVTDFTVGSDKLDLSDFLKGQGIKAPGYSDVIRLVDTLDANRAHNALVQGLVNGNWHDVVVLDHINVSQITIADLVL